MAESRFAQSHGPARRAGAQAMNADFETDLPRDIPWRAPNDDVPTEHEWNEYDLLRRENAILRAELEMGSAIQGGSDSNENDELPSIGESEPGAPILWTNGGWVQPASWAAEKSEQADFGERQRVDPADANEQAPERFPLEFFQEWREEQRKGIDHLALEIAALSSEVRRLRLEFSNGHRVSDIQNQVNGNGNGNGSGNGNGYPPAHDPAVTIFPPAYHEGPRLAPIMPVQPSTRLASIAIRVVAIILTLIVCGGLLYLLFS